MAGKGRGRVVETYTMVDPTTGEVMDQRAVYRETKSAAEDSYWKCYNLQQVEKGLRDVSFGMVNAVMKRMAYAGKGQMLHLDAATKQEIAAELETSPRMVERGIKALVDAGVLRRLRRCLYQVNPYYFGKGSWPSVMRTREAFDAPAGGVAGK